MIDKKAAEYVNSIVDEEGDNVVDAIRLYEAYQDGWNASRQPENNVSGWAIVFFIFIGFICGLLFITISHDFLNLKLFSE